MNAVVHNGDGTRVFTIHKFLHSWNPTEADWNNYESGASWSNPSGDVGSAVEEYHLNSMSCDFDITNIVQDFVQNPSENYGFYIKANNPYGFSFISSSGDEGSRPRIAIEYDGGTSTKQPSHDKAYRNLSQTSFNGNVQVFDLRGKSQTTQNAKAGASNGVYLVRYSNGTVKRIAGNSTMHGFNRN